MLGEVLDLISYDIAVAPSELVLLSKPDNRTHSLMLPVQVCSSSLWSQFYTRHIIQLYLPYILAKVNDLAHLILSHAL
jgi:hypothetical protein